MLAIGRTRPWSTGPWTTAILLVLVGAFALFELRLPRPARSRQALAPDLVHDSHSLSSSVTQEPSDHLISLAADSGSPAEEEARSPSEAVGRWDWKANGASHCMSVAKGVRYWVEDRRETGWTYIRSIDYGKQGWVPDASLYHGKPTVVRRAYSSKGIAVVPGDSVWVLDRKEGKKDGRVWVYVLFGDKEAWIDEVAVREKDIFHPIACFVNATYTAKDAAHLSLRKGEVVWANINLDPAADWLFAENARKQTGWVPREHLIKSRPLPVFQSFTSEMKVRHDAPKPLLFVHEGDTVWVEERQSHPGWIHAYAHSRDGYVPVGALLEAEVDSHPNAAPPSSEESRAQGDSVDEQSTSMAHPTTNHSSPAEPHRPRSTLAPPARDARAAAGNSSSAARLEGDLGARGGG